MDFNTTAVTNFVSANHLGDYSSIIGLIITLIGFLITIITLNKTKKASEIATKAVKAIQHDLKKIDTVTNLSSVLTEMEEIKRLHREKNYSQLLDKYSKLRVSLISVKSSNPALTEEDSTILQGAITQLKASEKIIDKHLHTNVNSQPDNVKLNGLISNHIDKLQEVLIRVKSKVGVNP